MNNTKIVGQHSKGKSKTKTMFIWILGVAVIVFIVFKKFGKKLFKKKVGPTSQTVVPDLKAQ